MAQQNLPNKETKVLTWLTPRVADILFYERVVAGPYRKGKERAEAGTAHPQTTSWPNHKLCAVVEDGEPGWLRFYYAAGRESQHLYNWELDRGEGALLPRCKQTWVLLRSAVVDALFDPASLTAPPLPGTWTQTGSRYVRIGDERLDGLFVVVECDWEILGDTLVGYELDELTGELLPYTREKMTKAAAEAAKQAPDASGIYKEVEPINSRFSWLITRKATSLAGTTQSWDEVQESVPSHIFPNVLQALSWAAVERYVESGGEDTYIERIMFIPTMKEAWRGPVKVSVTREWSHTPWEITLPAQPRPEKILWDAILDTLSLPPCIHANLGTITATIGTEDPWRPTQSSSITIGASPDHTDWPETLVYSNQQRMYRGGYLKETLTAHKPY